MRHFRRAGGGRQGCLQFANLPLGRGALLHDPIAAGGEQHQGHNRDDDQSHRPAVGAFIRVLLLDLRLLVLLLVPLLLVIVFVRDGVFHFPGYTRYGLQGFVILVNGVCGGRVPGVTAGAHRFAAVRHLGCQRLPVCVFIVFVVFVRVIVIVFLGVLRLIGRGEVPVPVQFLERLIIVKIGKNRLPALGARAGLLGIRIFAAGIFFIHR